MVHTPRGPDPGTVMRRFGMGPGDSFGTAKLRLGIQTQTDGCILLSLRGAVVARNGAAVRQNLVWLGLELTFEQ